MIKRPFDPLRRLEAFPHTLPYETLPCKRPSSPARWRCPWPVPPRPFSPSPRATGRWASASTRSIRNPATAALADGTLPVRVDTDVKPTLTFEYFVRDNLGVEVIAAWPFEHDISIAGLGTVGSTKQLPPTVSLQYHFNTKGKVSPFLGAGVNYTTFFSEDTRGALAGSKLKLDDSWGLAAHAGVDFALNERSAIRIDARWIDIDTDVKLDGADLGTVNIDPIVYGAAYVMKF